MSRDASSLRRLLLASVPRLGWGALLALHAAILIAAGVALVADGVTAGRLWSTGSLALTVVFCGLKLWDVPLLRLRSGRQSFVALCLIVALVHQGSIVRRVDDPSAGIAATVTFTTVCVAAATLRPATIRRWRDGLRALLAGPAVPPTVLGRIDARRIPYRGIAPCVTGAPRAPPAC